MTKLLSSAWAYCVGPFSPVLIIVAIPLIVFIGMRGCEFGKMIFQQRAEDAHVKEWDEKNREKFWSTQASDSAEWPPRSVPSGLATTAAIAVE